jgi:hypothetical protein
MHALLIAFGKAVFWVALPMATGLFLHLDLWGFYAA